VIIAGSVSNDEAREIWPDGWEEPKPYIRIVPQPGNGDARAADAEGGREGSRAKRALTQRAR
jgi:hypothetical protein